MEILENIMYKMHNSNLHSCTSSQYQMKVHHHTLPPPLTLRLYIFICVYCVDYTCEKEGN